MSTDANFLTELMANRKRYNQRVFTCTGLVETILNNIEAGDVETIPSLLEELEQETSKLISVTVYKMLNGTDPRAKGMADDNEENDYFFGNMVSLMNREISHKSIPAAMAVTIRKGEPLLIVNPLFLFSPNFLGDIHAEFSEQEIQQSLLDDNTPAASFYMRQIISILCHEMYHIALDHLRRFRPVIINEHTRNMMNIATDCTINQLLNYLPEGTVTLDYLKEITERDDLVEHDNSMNYFRVLMETQEEPESEPQPDPNADPDSGDVSVGSGGSGTPRELTPEEIEQLLEDLANMSPEELEQLRDSLGQLDDHGKWGEDETAEQDANNGNENVFDGLIQQAHDNYSEQRRATDRMRGTLSGNLQEVIDRLKQKGLMNWKQVLKRKVGTLSIPYTLSKNRINRRQPYRPELRGRKNDRTLRIKIAIDTSGSMTNEIIAYALNEIYNLLKVFKLEIEVIEFDSSIKHIYKVKNPNKLNYQVHGRGGTSYQPVVDYIKDQKINNREALVIFLTDGGGESNVEFGSFSNFLWLVVEENQRLSVDNFKGQVMTLDSDKKYQEMFQNRNS